MNIQIQLNGTWQEVSKREFLELVNAGVIRPDTEVALNGQKGVAAKINGLVFPSDTAVPPLQSATEPSPVSVPAPKRYVDKAPVASLKEPMAIQVELNGVFETVTKGELFALASQGKITSATAIEVNGKQATAVKVQGIVFGSPTNSSLSTTAPKPASIVPVPTSQNMVVTSPAKTVKDCPFCGEEIYEQAKKCRHCNELLDVVLRAQNQPPQPAPVAAAAMPTTINVSPNVHVQQHTVMSNANNGGCANSGCGCLILLGAGVVALLILAANS